MLSPEGGFELSGLMFDNSDNGRISEPSTFKAKRMTIRQSHGQPAGSA
jgi:hypothetical protein